MFIWIFMLDRLMTYGKTEPSLFCALGNRSFLCACTNLTFIHTHTCRDFGLQERRDKNTSGATTLPKMAVRHSRGFIKHGFSYATWEAGDAWWEAGVSCSNKRSNSSWELVWKQYMLNNKTRLALPDCRSQWCTLWCQESVWIIKNGASITSCNYGETNNEE